MGEIESCQWSYRTRQRLTGAVPAATVAVCVRYLEDPVAVVVYHSRGTLVFRVDPRVEHLLPENDGEDGPHSDGDVKVEGDHKVVPALLGIVSRRRKTETRINTVIKSYSNVEGLTLLFSME